MNTYVWIPLLIAITAAGSNAYSPLGSMQNMSDSVIKTLPSMLPPSSTAIPSSHSSVPNPSSSSMAPPSPSSLSMAPPTPSSSSMAPPTPSSSSMAPPTPSSSSMAPPTPSSSSMAPPTPSSSSMAPPSPLSSSMAPPTPSSSSMAPPTPSPSSMVSSNSSKKVSSSTSVAPSPSNATVSPSASNATISPSPSSPPAPRSSSHIPTTPKPPPSTDLHFKVMDKTLNKSCILLAGEIEILVSYQVNGSGKMLDKKLSLVEKGGKASGNCYSNNVKDAFINIMWPGYYSLTLDFKQNDKDWFVSGIAVVITPGNNTGIHTNRKELVASMNYTEARNDDLFQAQQNHSYLCTLEKNVDLANMNNVTDFSITVDFISVKLQPFVSDEEFPLPSQCPANSTDKPPNSSIVPIAVGGALAGLIVIVLVAYLIGRRRGNRGYQQV